jgi:phosphatidate cytidylyltransferase
MSDDAWRRERRDEDEDFGPPLFGDVPTTEVRPGDLSFGDSDTGSLPHWTEPPTGEIPRVLSNPAPTDPTEDLDVWSSFSTAAPVWSDDAPSAASDPSGSVPITTGPSASQPVWSDDTAGDPSTPVRREPGRIMIGTDPTDSAGRPMPRRGRQDPPARGARGTRPAPPRVGTRSAPADARDMPTAVLVGLGIGIVFIIAAVWRPWAALVVVVVVLGLAALEYFDKVTEKGYHPATIIGVAACVAAPLGAYWVGETAIPLILVLAFGAGSVTFMGSSGVESGPMPNMAITTLGITWIALLGSFAALILKLSTVPVLVAGGHVTRDLGTDTLVLLAIGVVANDVGAFFVGSATGRHPLRRWISPNKSAEGLLGGSLATLVVLGAIGAAHKSTTWNSLGDCLLLGLVICVAAPIGDLTESMFKRNLDIKDFGTIVKGHGGVLDRFDGFLFTLPAAYYLLEIVKPWVTK